MLTNFSEIAFNEQDHSYTYQGNALIGANRLIKQIQKPFDREGQAARIAERDNRSVEAILREWDDKGEVGRRKGTDTHAHIMKVLKAKGSQEDTDPFLALNNPLPEIVAFEAAWLALKDDITLDPDYVEWVVGDAQMGTAGTIDACFFSYKTGCFHIWDWKTGKFELDNRFQRLLPPFNDLQDCQINTFSLIVSLYRLMVERNKPNMPMGDAYLVHLNSYGRYTIHKAIDFRARLADWLGVA